MCSSDLSASVPSGGRFFFFFARNNRDAIAAGDGRNAHSEQGGDGAARQGHDRVFFAGMELTKASDSRTAFPQLALFLQASKCSAGKRSEQARNCGMQK